MAFRLLSATPVPNHQTDGPSTFLDAAIILSLIGLVLLLFFFGLIMLLNAHYRRQKTTKRNEKRLEWCAIVIV